MPMDEMDEEGSKFQFLGKGVAEGRKFQEDVTNNPGEAVGSPHVRIALVTLHSLINEHQGKPQVKELTEWWRKVTANEATEEEMGAEILIFRCQAPKTPSKTWKRKGIMKKGKGKGSKMDDIVEEKYIKVKFCLETKSAQAALLDFLLEMGGIQKTGTPPPNPHIRQLKKLLKGADRD